MKRWGLPRILLALGLLIWLAYRGWSVLLLAPAAALVAAAFAREPLLAHWTQTFMGSAARFLASSSPLTVGGSLATFDLRFHLLLEVRSTRINVRLTLHAPASTAVTASRKEPDERMISFSASTTRKNTRPAMKSHGQTQSGMASVSNRRCSGGA